jgi:hypothetical protein
MAPRPELCVQRGDYRNKGYNPEKLFWVRFSVKMVFVAWKLITIKEQCQNQCRFFRQRDYRNKGKYPEKLQGSSPGEDVYCTLETNDGRGR